MTFTLIAVVTVALITLWLGLAVGFFLGVSEERDRRRRADAWQFDTDVPRHTVARASSLRLSSSLRSPRQAGSLPYNLDHRRN
jgi:hypothetical protein